MFVVLALILTYTASWKEIMVHWFTPRAWSCECEYHSELITYKCNSFKNNLVHNSCYGVELVVGITKTCLEHSLVDTAIPSITCPKWANSVSQLASSHPWIFKGHSPIDNHVIANQPLKQLRITWIRWKAEFQCCKNLWSD